MAGPVTPRGPSLPAWLLPACIGAGYLVMAQAIRFLGPADFDGPVFWPAAGLALGALLITEHRRWAWILVAVALGETASNLVSGLAVLPSLGWALANVIHPLVAAGIIRRLHPRFALDSLPQLGAFVLVGAGLGPLLSATIGTLTGVLALDRGWGGWLQWWIGDGLGALVVAPLFVAWRRRARHGGGWELLVTAAALAVVASLVFRNWTGDVAPILPYLVLPPLVWCAVRFEVPGAAIGIAVVGLVGGWSTSLGYGPFALQGDTVRVLFDIYLVVLIATTLLVGVLRANLVEREELHATAERRRETVEALNEELAHAVSLRDQLVSMVSHELRGPLTPILGFAVSLQRPDEQAPLSDEQRSAVDAIHRNAAQMLALIDDLLVSARIQAGQLHASPRPVDVPAEVRRILEEQLDAQDIDLHVDPDAPRLAMVERGHLNQILTNLVTNARKYGRPPVEIRLTAAGAQLRIEVADHGAGVDPAVQPVMFERFTRAGGPGSADTEQGFGLGLAIVRTLAEANGGRVDYQAPDGDGLSAFIVTLRSATTDRLDPVDGAA